VSTPYPELNAAYQARQHQRAAQYLEGWRAWHAAQRKADYTERPHSRAWMDGWNAASVKAPLPTESNILDLCPGSVGAPMQAPVDPSHIAGTLRWVCPHCRWRVSVAGISPHQAPPYVPMHPLVAGAESASPLAGPAVAVLEST
jgi:hypothetical protein